jgi:hypothetical protein
MKLSGHRAQPDPNKEQKEQRVKKHKHGAAERS